MPLRAACVQANEVLSQADMIGLHLEDLNLSGIGDGIGGGRTAWIRRCITAANKQ